MTMTSSVCILTVATVSHAAQSVATLRSARRTGTYASYHLFAVDATAETVADLRRKLGPDASWIHVFGPNDLGPERVVFLDAFDRYNPVELSCLAKYVGVSHVLRGTEAGETCIFADSDMLFLDDVHVALAALGDSAVLLTPHLLGPSTDNLEHDIMIHGWMNAGFLAFRRGHPDTGRILDWLISRISRRGYLAPQHGMSCDQTWVSALPVVFRDATSVSRHPGLNVGYWNLMERPLTGNGSVVMAGDSPLLLFHFSGFDWKRTGRLSIHSDVPVSSGSPLEDLCRLYQTELDSAAELGKSLTELATFDCSHASLSARMRIGSERSGVKWARCECGTGLFSRLGNKIDLLLHATSMRYRR